MGAHVNDVFVLASCADADAAPIPDKARAAAKALLYFCGPVRVSLLPGGGVRLEDPVSVAASHPVEALEYTLRSLGGNLRAAREHAGLTQAQLAKKLKKAQATVSGSEAGKTRVSEAYVLRLLKVCGLPKDWKAPR